MAATWAQHALVASPEAVPSHADPSAKFAKLESASAWDQVQKLVHPVWSSSLYYCCYSAQVEVEERVRWDIPSFDSSESFPTRFLFHE